MELSKRAIEALIQSVKENNINAIRDIGENINTPWGVYPIYPFLYDTDTIKAFRFPGNVNTLSRKNIIYTRAKILSNLPGYLRVNFNCFSL